MWQYYRPSVHFSADSIMLGKLHSTILRKSVSCSHLQCKDLVKYWALLSGILQLIFP